MDLHVLNVDEQKFQFVIDTFGRLIAGGHSTLPDNVPDINPETGCPYDYPDKVQELLSSQQRSELSALLDGCTYLWATSLKSMCDA